MHFSKTRLILLLLKQPLIYYYYSYALRPIVVVVNAADVLAVAVLLRILLALSITGLNNTCLSIVEWEEKAGLILLG